MRKLSIHLGLHKTGTSYLQALLVRNREQLSVAGLAVPPATHKDAHEQYALALRDDGAPGFLDEVDWSLGEHQIISSERVGSLICTPRLGLAKALAEQAGRENIALQILLVLRRQDILKESIFSEVVKTWYEGSILEESHYDYDFNRRLEYLENAFGQEQIRVDLYPESGSRPLAKLFMDMIGIDQSGLRLTDVERKNVRMNRRETMLLSQIPKKQARFTGAVRTAIEGNNLISDDGHRNLMSPAQREEFLSRYTQGNKAFMSKYGLIDEHWSNPEFDGGAVWRSPEPIRPQEYVSVMMEAIRFERRRKQNANDSG